MNKIVLTIEDSNPSCVHVEMHEKSNGFIKVTKKRVALCDYLLILQKSVSNIGFRIGKLPSGFYDGFLDSDGLGFKCIIVIPKGVKPLIYYDAIYNIPFPTMVWNFTVRCNELKKSQVFVAKTDDIKDNTKLFKYPFGNVYDDGRICWGGNLNKEIRTIREVEKVISTFFGSSTNDDLWKVGTKISLPTSNDSRCLQRGLIESLVGEEIFPNEILVPTEYNVGKLLELKPIQR